MMGRLKKPQWSKVIPVLTILAGFVIAEQCLDLMRLCIELGYTAAAGWLTAAVGLAQAVIISGPAGYLSLCKSDHSTGGITFESAKAKGFQMDGADGADPAEAAEDHSVDSPPI